MTPKEKAEQLVQKYYVEVLFGNSSDYSDKQLRVFKIKSKTCALIAVDEMINILVMVFDNDDTKIESYDFMDKRITYLEEVKQEIEKL